MCMPNIKDSTKISASIILLTMSLACLPDADHIADNIEIVRVYEAIGP